MQGWGLLHLQTLFLSDQKFLSVSLSSPKQPAATKTSSHCTRKTKKQQERKAHHQHTRRHQKRVSAFRQRRCGVPPSAQQDANAFPSGRICSGGAVLWFVYYEKNSNASAPSHRKVVLVINKWIYLLSTCNLRVHVHLFTEIVFS